MDGRADGDGEGERGSSAWVSRYRSSGLSLRDFARRHRLSPGRLRYWVYGKRWNAGLKGEGVRFQEVKLGSLLAGSSWGAEVDLPGGLRVRASGAANPAWVVEVVRGLRGIC